MHIVNEFTAADCRNGDTCTLAARYKTLLSGWFRFHITNFNWNLNSMQNMHLLTDQYQSRYNWNDIDVCRIQHVNEIYRFEVSFSFFSTLG